MLVAYTCTRLFKSVIVFRTIIVIGWRTMNDEQCYKTKHAHRKPTHYLQSLPFWTVQTRTKPTLNEVVKGMFSNGMYTHTVFVASEVKCQDVCRRFHIISPPYKSTRNHTKGQYSILKHNTLIGGATRCLSYDYLYSFVLQLSSFTHHYSNCRFDVGLGVLRNTKCVCVSCFFIRHIWHISHWSKCL